MIDKTKIQHIFTQFVEALQTRIFLEVSFSSESHKDLDNTHLVFWVNHLAVNREVMCKLQEHFIRKYGIISYILDCNEHNPPRSRFRFQVLIPRNSLPDHHPFYDFLPPINPQQPVPVNLPFE